MFDNEPVKMPPPNPMPQPPMPPQDIHTMPERFLDAGGPTSGAPASAGGKGSSGIGKKLIIAGVSVVVVGALGAGAWYYFTKMSNSNTENGNITVVNTNRTNTNANSNTNLNSNLNSNVNSNLNTNSLPNTNVNTNLNQNSNTNLNSNLNSNVNSNLNTNTNSSTVTTGTPLSSSTDSDSDGFTDIEEQVYATNANNPDTDGDGFIDGMRKLANGSYEGEVYNGYCPTKIGSVRLDDTTCAAVRTYSNTTFNYAMWVPKNWLVQPTATDEKTVIITPDIATSEFFQISVLDNPTQLTAKNYYLSLNPGVDPTAIKDATTNGLDGVLSLDQSTVYLMKGTKMYIITYNTDSLTKVNFRSTFTMMYRSFRLVAATTTNTNTSTVNTNQ